MTGVWLVASRALQRRVDVHERPYPHIDGERVPTRRGEVRLGPMHCAACADTQHRREAASQTPPPVDDDQRALEARRLGERE